MSKKNEMGLALSADIINDNLHAAAIGAEEITPISRAEAFDWFLSANDSEFETLGGGEYLDWSKMKPGKYVYEFVGLTSWKGKNRRTGEEEIVEAISIRDINGSEFICAAKLVVDACKKITQMPCMVRFVYEGEGRTSAGNNFFKLKTQVGRGSIAQ